MMVSEQVTVTIITGIVSIIVGILGGRHYDRMRSGSSNGNGNGGNGVQAMAQVMAQREEVAFQTRVMFVLENLTAAIKAGHSASAKQLEKVSEALDMSADVMREVHKEIVEHRESVQPAVDASTETLQLVQALHKKEFQR